MKTSRNLKDGSLPVFVFPESLTFYADDQSTLKQILTIYNPYTFSVQFKGGSNFGRFISISSKVFGTAPRCYKVTEAEGVIKPRCYVDVVIRCVEVSRVAERSDKFRLCLFKYGMGNRIGEKEIIALVLPTKTTTQERPSKSKVTSKSFKPHHLQAFTEDVKSGPGALVIGLGLFCIVALMLPTDGERNTTLPPYLHLTMSQKLIAAYILGLVTMAVLRAQ